MAEQPSGVYVRAYDSGGKWGAVDALDLTDESFRRFVLRLLFDAGLVMAIGDEIRSYAPLQSAVTIDEGDSK